MLKRIADKLDMSKRFPGYFDKRIFRIAIGIIFVMHLIALHFNGYNLTAYYFECPDGETCLNPFFECQNGNPWERSQGCYPDVPDDMCEDLRCKDRYVTETINPNPFILHVNTVSFLLFGFAFLVNHLYWVIKR